MASKGMMGSGDGRPASMALLSSISPSVVAASLAREVLMRRVSSSPCVMAFAASPLTTPGYKEVNCNVGYKITDRMKLRAVGDRSSWGGKGIPRARRASQAQVAEIDRGGIGQQRPVLPPATD
jgi:hypothetical protein